jgi:hypothetical protein
LVGLPGSLDLLVQGGGVDGASTAGDRVSDKLLHRDECVTGLGGPAPVSVWLGGIGDGLELTQGVRVIPISE